VRDDFRCARDPRHVVEKDDDLFFTAGIFTQGRHAERTADGSLNIGGFEAGAIITRHIADLRLPVGGEGKLKLFYAVPRQLGQGYYVIQIASTFRSVSVFYYSLPQTVMQEHFHYGTGEFYCQNRRIMTFVPVLKKSDIYESFTSIDIILTVCL